MVRKINAKLVLQLRNQSLSRRTIESAHKISRHSIQSVFGADGAQGSDPRTVLCAGPITGHEEPWTTHVARTALPAGRDRSIS